MSQVFLQLVVAQLNDLFALTLLPYEQCGANIYAFAGKLLCSLQYIIIILGRAQPCYQSSIDLPERESWALQGALSSSKSRGDVELKFKRTRRADSI